MDKLYVIHYGKKNSAWKVGVPMSNKLAEKQARLLALNGYDVKVVPYEGEFHG